MTQFLEELQRVLAVGRSWVGRDLQDTEIEQLVKWLEAERAQSGQPPSQIDQGLAAATAVINEGRQAAEFAMDQAFKSVRPQSSPAGAQIEPPQSLQQSVANTENIILQSVLAGTGNTDPNAPLAELERAQMAQQVGELIRIEVREQVDLQMVEAKIAIDKKLIDLTNSVVEICNTLSADIREQLARELAMHSARKTPVKKR